MGSEKSKNRDSLGEEEINSFFANYKNEKIVNKNSQVATIKVNNKEYPLYPDKDIESIINVNNFDNSKVEYKFNIAPKAPSKLKGGEILGEYTAIYEGNEYSGKLQYKQ